MNTRIIIVVLLLSILFPNVSNTTNEVQNLREPATIPTDLSGVKVATFHGSNTEIHNACRVAMESMFLWMNATVDTISAQDIKDGVLYNYDILGVPPGDLGQYVVSLGSDGLDAMRDYIRNGGSYVGISRGAQFACETVVFLGSTVERPLQLFNGTARGPVDGIADQSMFVVNVNKSCPGIDLSGQPDSLTMMGWETVIFVPDETMPPLNHITQYSTTGQASMITYEYGHGTVFLSGVHPELEEDGDRDNSDYFDHHEDPETDWPLMLEVSRWLVETSTWDNASIPQPTTLTTTPTGTTTTTTTTGNVTDGPISDVLVIVAGVSTLGIVVVIVAIMRRRS